MKRTTIYLEPELEVLLKTEMVRQHRTMAEIVRDAVREYVSREPRQAPPGAGAFASGHADTAEQADAILQETKFAIPRGDVTHAARRPPATRSASPKRSGR